MYKRSGGTLSEGSGRDSWSIAPETDPDLVPAKKTLRVHKCTERVSLKILRLS